MDRPCSSIRSSDERVTATPYRSILLEQNATVGCDLREIFHGDHRVALVYDDDGAQNDTTPTKPQINQYSLSYHFLLSHHVIIEYLSRKAFTIRTSIG